MHGKDVLFRHGKMMSGALLTTLGWAAFAATGVVADVGRTVFDDAAPALPAWSFSNRDDILRLSVAEIDGERVMCVSNPLPARVSKDTNTKTRWAVFSPRFAVRPETDLEVALRMITPAPETGGVPQEKCRTGVAWFDAKGREIGFRTMGFPSREPHLRTFVRRQAVPKDAVAAQISVGFLWPEFPRDGHVFGLASARARLLTPGEKGEADPRFEETHVPSLRLLTESPCEDASATIELEVDARHAIDWTAFVLTLDGRAAPERFVREGNRLKIRPPAGGWKMPSFPEIGISGRDASGTRFEDSRFFCFGTRVRKNLVTLRDDGMTLVDGKPFFPIGIYWPIDSEKVDDAVLKAVKDMGFNTVHSNIGGLKYMDAFLSGADRHGFKVLMGLGGDRDGMRPLCESAMGNFNDGRDVLDNVYRLREHPSLLAWYTGDDTSSHQSVRHLKGINDRVKAIDNAHLTAQADSILWRDLTLSRYTRFVDCSDVLIPEFYPSTKPELTGRETPEILRDMVYYDEDMRLAGNPAKGLWPVLQAFRGHGLPRFPTAAEQRAQTWLSIVRGGHGVLWYRYSSTSSRDPNQCGFNDNAELKKIVTDVVAELNVHLPDLVTRKAKEQPKVEIVSGEPKDPLGFPAINVLLKEGAETPLLIAVNSSIKPVTARLTVGEKVLEERFEPLDVRLIRVR